MVQQYGREFHMFNSCSRDVFWSFGVDTYRMRLGLVCVEFRSSSIARYYCFLLLFTDMTQRS